MGNLYVFYLVQHQQFKLVFTCAKSIDEFLAIYLLFLLHCFLLIIIMRQHVVLILRSSRAVIMKNHHRSFIYCICVIPTFPPNTISWFVGTNTDTCAAAGRDFIYVTDTNQSFFGTPSSDREKCFHRSLNLKNIM